MKRTRKRVVVSSHLIVAFVALGIVLATLPALLRNSGTPVSLAQQPSPIADQTSPPPSTDAVVGPGTGTSTQAAPASETAAAAAVLATPTVAALPKGDWRLTFNDEFDGPTLDASKWTPSFWWGNIHRDVELAAYSQDNLEFSNGWLRLRIDKRPLQGFPYSSGMISSHGNFSQEFGYFELRARVPRGEGLWPAFWLLPEKRTGTTWPPEIDVMEIRAGVPHILNMTHHYLDYDGKHEQEGGGYTSSDLSLDFHTYALEWGPVVSVWYLDGKQVWRSLTERIRGPMYLIANLAAGDWAGKPDSRTVFPSYFDIDYIRVYQRAERLR